MTTDHATRDQATYKPTSAGPVTAGSQLGHPAFETLRSRRIDSLGLDVTEYRHRKTGALHYHLAAEHQEKVFLVALRTYPEDSTGVAHVLEHTALCGSERYPVRDPFFMMIRRSLNTFMNAFTSSDWTAYPFATQNAKDFNNLLDVYLDSVFFSGLDPLDFAQEGQRLEFEEPLDPATPLTRRGVVYNEMKGAMSSPVSLLWQTLSRYLFPTTTYHHNSGGDPACIPDLEYDQLLAFYREHYHPTNAVFMTFGDLPAEEHQARMDELALCRFEPLEKRFELKDEKRYFAPLRVEEAYPLDQEDLGAKTHVVVGWLLGHSSDLEAQLEAELMTRVLLDNSSSPLRHALETTELAKTPSPLCGLEDSNREMTFVCGLEGTEPERADAVEQLILMTLEDVARRGVPHEQVAAVLHQLELSQRELGGDGFPYGLQLVMTGLSTALHGGDPISVLDLDPVLTLLRERIKAEDYIPSLVRRLLLDNPHRVRLTLRPDAALNARREAADKATLARLKEAMSEEEKAALVSRAQALDERQRREDDDSILPRVGLEDVPATLKIAEGDKGSLNCGPWAFYPQETNGLVYQEVLVELPELNQRELQLLPLYAICLTELGVGERSYQQAQAWQSAVSGGLSAYTTVRGSIEDVQRVQGYFTLSSKALARNTEALMELLGETFRKVRFDELAHIRELVAHQYARKYQSLTGKGHALAMMAASSELSPAARLAHAQRGLEGIVFLQQLDRSLDEEAGLEAFAEELRALHGRLLKAPRRFLSVAEESQREPLRQALENTWTTAETTADFTPFALAPINRQVRQAWSTDTQVNFCARAYATVPVNHPDSPALVVLGDFLRNGYLHRAIREQGGAYGGGASQDSAGAAFRFFSYRDPRLEETLEDFDASLEWLLEEGHEPARLEEAILGVVSHIDKPASPAGEARQAYHSELFGRTPEQRRAYRARVLKVTLEDLRRVVTTYLRGQPASTAVITNGEQAARLANQGYQHLSL